MDEEKLSAETTLVDENQNEDASVADTSNEVEFEDTNEDKTESENQQKNERVSKKTNSDYARERRQAERTIELKKAKYDAIIEALDGINPYTQEKMVDEADIEEYLTMKSIAKSGNDPIADYSRFAKEKSRETQKQLELHKKQEEWIFNDKNDFISKHPDVSLDELLQDDLFVSFAMGKVGSTSMDKIYTDYQSFIQKSEERVKNKTAQILANTASTPGVLANQPTTPRSIGEMSKQEFESMVEKVKRGELR